MIEFSPFNDSNLKTFCGCEDTGSFLSFSTSSLNEYRSPDSLCLLAARHLQHYLENQNEWSHNFGLTNESEEQIIGKMFGVLIVTNANKEIGYLAAFSGKLAGKNILDGFVPPVFDGLTENSFLNIGMGQLNSINFEISKLEDIDDNNFHEIEFLKYERKELSIALQQQLFESYNFLNPLGKEMNLVEIFKKAGYRNPPSGAGECAAPKLLQYAFQNNLQPIALTEFWWGLSPKSETWKHDQFYRPCKEKCKPILAHMLEGLNDFVIL